MEDRYRRKHQSPTGIDETVRAQTWLIVISASLILPVVITLYLLIHGSLPARGLIAIGGMLLGLQKMYRLMLNWLRD